MAEQKRSRKLSVTTVSSSSRHQINPNGVKELSERLMDLSSAKEISREVIKLVHYLKSKSLRHERNAHAFRMSGGLAALMKLLQRCTKQAKDLTLLLGTLGNLCALEQETKSMVMNTVLSDIVAILKTSKDPGVVNTASRVIGNFAVDQRCICQIRAAWEGIAKDLTYLLARMQDSSCKQSILRTLKHLCADSVCRIELSSQEQLLVLSDCLKAKNNSVVSATLRTMEALTQPPDPDTIVNLCSIGVIQMVMDRLSEVGSTSDAQSCINILLSCAQCCDGRVFLGSGGGVEALYRYTQSCSSGDQPRVVKGICWCCKDVVSRQKVRDCGALEKMVKMLSEEDSAPLHGDILSALVCFYFDENTLNYMVRGLGLLKALVYHLKRAMARANSNESGTKGEVKLSSPLKSSSKGSSSENSESHMTVDQKEHETSVEVSSEGETSGDSSISSFPAALSPGSSTSSYPAAALSPGSSYQSSSSLTTSSSHSGQSEDVWSVAMGYTLNEIPLCPPPLVEAAETPPPSKRLRISLEHHKPVPANFIDTLLSPSPGSSQPVERREDLAMSPINLITSTEGQVVLLLSRVSHLRDCLGCLAAPDVLIAILDYFFSTMLPNVHCFKVLVRVFTNPQCLRDCVISLAPSLIYQRLESAIAEASSGYPAQATSPSHVVSCTQPAGSGILHCPLSSNTSDPPSLTMTNVSTGPQPTHQSPFCVSGKELLERLSKVAESAYGQGVLAHTLLRGNPQEKEASVLALPLLSDSSRFREKMMMDYGGLKVLIPMVRAVRGSTQSLAIDSLLLLAWKSLGHNDQQPSVSRVIHERPKVPSLHSLATTQDTTLHRSLTLCVPQRQLHCKYLDTDHDPFDTVVSVCDGSGGVGASQTFPAHRSVLVEMSEVFAVMFSGRYQESSCGTTTIRGIRPSVFCSALHFMYGCHWDCPQVMATVLHQEATQSIACPDYHADLEQFSLVVNEHCIDAITSQLGSNEERILMGHCLRLLACAGRFLLPNLNTECEEYLVAHLCPGMVVPLFQFSELHSSAYLRARCIRCLLEMPHTELKRTLFQELLDSSDGEEAITLIQRLILCPNSLQMYLRDHACV